MRFGAQNKLRTKRAMLETIKMSFKPGTPTPTYDILLLLVLLRGSNQQNDRDVMSAGNGSSSFQERKKNPPISLLNDPITRAIAGSNLHFFPLRNLEFVILFRVSHIIGSCVILSCFSSPHLTGKDVASVRHCASPSPQSEMGLGRRAAHGLGLDRRGPPFFE